jgi:redox-sensing transcriptional repressor
MMPQKSIERIILYSNILEKLQNIGNSNTYSSELADLSGCSAVQVRGDLRCVGYSGNPQKGYIIKDLLEKIKNLLEPDEGITLAIIGIGNLGRAILGYFSTLKPKFKLIAAFDNDEQKVNRTIAGCRCYHVKEINTILQPFKIQLGAITVPRDYAQEAANLFINAGVKGLVNFAPVPIKAPGNIFVENMDITKTFEKVAYFARFQNRGGI